MDWGALLLSLKLSLVTVVILLPVSIVLGRILAYQKFYGKSIVQAILSLPLVLPPTVLGYYMLVFLGNDSIFNKLFGSPLIFNFSGLIIASIIFNLPFAIQPVQRAFEAIPRDIREAGACCGLTPLKVLWKIELPLSWRGIVSAMMLTFAHTIGEFGVVLMVGGNIPNETKTIAIAIAIAIYDKVQIFDNEAAAIMSMFLLVFSLIIISITYLITDNSNHKHE